HAGDGDPLDILVLMQEPVHPLTIVRARPIGGFQMRDDKGEDDKIIAVAVDDPAFAPYREPDQIAPHILVELRRFFQDYKVLEGKLSEVDELYGTGRAVPVMSAALEGYRERAAWAKG